MTDPEDQRPDRDGIEAQLARYGQVLRDHLTPPATEIPLDVPPTHRGHRRLAVATAVVVIMAALGLALVALRPAGTRVETASTTATTPVPAPVPGVDPHQLAARASMAELARRMQVDPSWTPMTAPPVPILAHAPSTPGTPNVETTNRWWISSAPWAQVDAWIAAHPPTGLTSDGRGFSADRTGPTARYSIFGPASELSTGRNQELLVTTALLPTGGTAIRMDVQVIWLPSRPPAATVAEGMSAVAVSVTWNGTSGPHPPPGRTFTDRATIEALRRTVNALSMALPGARNCAADFGLRFTLRFTGPDRPTTVVESGTCDLTTLKVGSQAAVDLATGRVLLDREAHLLGTTTSALDNESRQASSYPAAPTTTG
jgi:hypothetical protein